MSDLFIPPVPTQIITAGYGDITPAMREWMNHIVGALDDINSGGAPIDAEYVVMALDSTLTEERVLTAGDGITITDGGANGPVTISATGTGGDTITATASEAIAAGQFVSIYNDSGTPKCRVAKSSSGQGFQADGFCKDAFALGATATISLPGAVNVAGGTGLTAGDVWLGTDGYATNTAPTTAGYISQQIGVAENSTHVAFEPQPDVLIAATHAVSNGGSTQSVTFTSSTTYVVGTGAGWLTMVGGGAGGQSTTSSAATGGKGGGAGEFCQNFMVPFTPGETITITIGAGGAAGNDGGTTSVATSFGTYSVLGGKTAGTGGGPRGATAGSNGNPAGVGALGTAETPCHFGGSSGGGGNTTTSNAGAKGGGSAGYLVGGAGGTSNSHGGGGGGGGASLWGIGGAGGAGNAAGSDAPAGAYGAGGGGGGGNDGTGQTGGAGQPGVVVLMYVA